MMGKNRSSAGLRSSGPDGPGESRVWAAVGSGHAAPRGDSTGALRRVALGEEPPDLVIAGGTMFEAVTGEFLPDRALWVKDGRIARVTASSESVPSGVPVLDTSGLILVPGLIDGHTHINRLFVPEFVRALLPTGVTSVVTE
ncbi:MAG: hypothetical protein M1325_06740, partial [Actinobacteria bacterium]|nr:hypothetical protein [Actinomycetota bacterium]